MNILALETATDRCSVALAVAGTLCCRQSSEPRIHARRVLGMVDECLSEAGLAPANVDLITFGCGPGSFTGVRIATAVVQGLALGLECPVVPVSTLAAAAVGVCRQRGGSRVAVCVDARMDECYWGLYTVTDKGVAELLGEESVSGPDALPRPPAPGWLGVGSGWHRYPELARRMDADVEVLEPDLLPEARDLIKTARAAYDRGEAVAADAAMPVYLREQVAWRS
ncbi:MAG: tRNA (adenosine(37)-N6)-threonylcarbamoyltransferase complex dimerization subunit type 1 TsaB [Gammaproteobacteria bacterium]